MHPLDTSLELIQNVHDAISRGVDYPDILQVVTDMALAELGEKVTLAAIYEFDPVHDELNLVIASGQPQVDFAQAKALPLVEWSPFGSAFVPDITAESRLAFLREMAPEANLRCGLDVPLRSDTRLYAIFSLYSDQLFTPDEVTRGINFGLVACLAVQAAHLFKLAQMRAAEANALNQIAQAINANLNLEAILDIVASELGRLVPHVRASLALPIEHDPGHLSVRLLKGAGSPDQPVVMSAAAEDDGVGWAYTTGQPYIASDLQADASFAFDRSLRESGVRSYICLPLRQGEQVVGTLNLGGARPYAFGPHNLPILERIGAHLAVAIRNARLFALSQRRIVELDMLNDVGQALSSTLHVEELLQIIYEQTQRVLDADNLAIALYDEAVAELDFAFVMRDGRRQPAMKRKTTGSLTGAIVRSGEPIFLCGDITSQAEALGVKPGGHLPKIWMGVPLIYNNRVLGVLSVQHFSDADAYDRTQLRLLQAIANQAALALQNARLYEAQQRQAADQSARRMVLTAANRSPDLAGMLQLALAEVLGVIGLDAGWVMLCLSGDPDHQADMVVHQGVSEVFVAAEARVVTQCHVCADVLAERKAVSVVTMEACLYISPEIIKQEGLLSHLSIPITHQEQVIGVINVATHDPHAPDITSHIPLLEAIGQEIGAAVTNAHLYQTVQQEQQKLAAILHDTADLVLVLDETQQVILANTAVEQYLNVALDDVVNQPLLALGVPDLAAALRQAQEVATAVVREVALPDGRVLYASVSPVHGVGWVMVMQDITTLKELDRLRTEWVASVSHDLKNPLSVVQLSADMLERESALTARQRDLLARLQTGVSRLRSLVTDVLDLARLEAGSALRRSPVHLEAVAQEMLADVKPLAEERQQVLTADFPADLPPVYGDEAMLKRVIVNLLSNASKYTPDGGQITLALRQEGGAVQVSVSDNGYGIPDEALPYLFDRFYRVPGGVTAVEGTGLGLSIVKTIVEKHGGRIEVASELGVGSTFVFAIPVSQSN